MRIPKEIAPFAYKLSKEVYENILTFKAGQQMLASEHGINSNSAADYINNFRCLVEGKRFTRTQNAYAMEYFFANIYNDFGLRGLSNALKALRLHIEYYEQLQKVVMHKMRDIYTKYSATPIETPDEEEQKEIVRRLKKQNRTRQEIIEELEKLKPSDPEIVIISGKSFKRDNRTIAQIKLLRGIGCQICSTAIKKKDGSFYIEAAHIKPKCNKGCETPDNILLLCPNHHKEFDLCEREVLLHDKEKIHFTLNGQEHRISLKIE